MTHSFGYYIGPSLPVINQTTRIWKSAKHHKIEKKIITQEKQVVRKP